MCGPNAEAARRRTSDPEEGVERVVRLHVVGGAVGGFVTGLGGFVTMPVALPVNIAEFYIQATRMVGGTITRLAVGGLPPRQP